MAGRWLRVAAILATASAVAGCGSIGTKVNAAEAPRVMTAGDEDKLKGYDITETGLRPRYPSDFLCSPLTSFYASWIDVDGSRRAEPHSGVDGGHLGDAVLAPAPGVVRRV